MMKRYKFLRENLKSYNGDISWELNKWKKHEGELDMCNSGFHCSKEKYQAFSYVQGEILAEVEVKGKSIKQDDKEVWSEMRIVKLWKWQKKDSVALAIYAAELCLNNFEKVYPDDKRPREAIEAAKRYLDNSTDENRSAAASAASAAASVASAAASAASAESAASAASAAASAASAAWSAVRGAASAAASVANAVRGANLINKIFKWMDKRQLDDYET